MKDVRSITVTCGSTLSSASAHIDDVFNALYMLLKIKVTGTELGGLKI